MPLLAHQSSSTTSASSSSPASVADRLAMSYNQGSKISYLPNLPETVKSQSIPINGMHRTASELQLCEDEALADYRDFVVYSRIVNGITRQQEKSHNLRYRQENDKCLAHIVSTRHGNDTLQSLSRHIVHGMTMTDDYFCGEEPPESADSAPSSGEDAVDDVIEEEGIFALEL